MKAVYELQYAAIEPIAVQIRRHYERAGFALGSALGVALGVVMGAIPLVRRVLEP